MVIFNPKEFLSRIDRAMKHINLKYSWNLVQYYDEKTHNGDLGVYHKPLKFKHQNEFRIFVEYNHESPLVLNIGSIEDISEILEIEEFERVRFKFEYVNK